MKKNVFSTKVMAEIALMAALAFVLDLLQSAICKFMPFWPNGGSVGIAMIPIIILAYRRGTLCGLLGGFIVGLMDMLDGVSISPMADVAWKAILSAALDYVLCWTLVGFAGVFSKKIKNSKTKNEIMIWGGTGALLAGFLKFLSNFLSGLFMWPSFDQADPMAINATKVIFSISYNGSYMLPTTILCIVVACLLLIYQPKALVLNDMLKYKEIEE